jgi:two-component system sensor histidine kinase KdpD
VADHEPGDDEQEQLDALRRLTSVLGAHLLIERGDDLVATTQRVAHDRGTTYVLMGAPKQRSAIGRMMSPALPLRLIGALPGVDLRIVADRTRRNGVQR